MDEEAKGRKALDLQVCGYGSSQISEIRISSQSQDLSPYSHISKFDLKPIATLSKTSFEPSYLEPSKLPKTP